MSLVLQYKFDQADLTIDSSTSGIPLVNAGGVVSSVDATYGNVASFDGSSNSYLSSGTSLSTLQGSSSRTISYWLNRNAKGTFSIPYAYGNPGISGGGIRSAFNASGVLALAYNSGQQLDSNTSFSVGTWYHVAEVYDGTTLSFYIDGVFDTSATVSMNSSTNPLSIGQDLVHVVNSGFIYTGYMSDFRVYDDALLAADLLTITTNGPNASLLNLDTTMYTHVADLTWDAVPGATSYTVSSNENSGGEVTLGTSSGTTYEVFNLTPGGSYEFRVYTDLDIVTPAYAETETSLALNTTNVGSLMTRLNNDLTLLTGSASDEVEPFLRSILTTGDIVNTSIGDVVFVANTESLSLDEPEEKMMTPFEEASGSGQSISVVLPDTSINTVGYDQTTNEVVSGSTNYPVGTYFILGNRKVTVKEI